jgi:probable HAF family extracellular repeat protein
MKSLRNVVVCAILLTVLGRTAQAQSLARVKTLHFVQYPGSNTTYLLGVSNNEIGVGWYYGSDGIQYGFIVKNGKYLTVDDPNGIATALNGINSSGTAVGYYYKGDGNPQAFSYANGVFTDIGPAGATGSAAFGINDLGEIVGEFVDVDGIPKGWIFNGTSYETVVVPSSIATSASDINMNGLVTVQWVTATGYLYNSAIYDGTTFTMIDVPVPSIPMPMESTRPEMSYMGGKKPGRAMYTAQR